MLSSLLVKVYQLNLVRVRVRFSGDDPYPTWDFFELGNFLKWNDPPNDEKTGLKLISKMLGV